MTLQPIKANIHTSAKPNALFKNMIHGCMAYTNTLHLWNATRVTRPFSNP